MNGDAEHMAAKKELLEQQLNFEDINSKLDGCQGNVELLRENLLEKESFLVSFKMETNAKIDEAIQYIKLIENEFQLKSVLPGNNDNDDWQVEEKLEQFPSFIKQIYRDFVNLRASNWCSDVETQNIIDFVHTYKVGDGSHKNIMYDRIGQLCHYHILNHPVATIANTPQTFITEKEYIDRKNNIVETQ